MDSRLLLLLLPLLFGCSSGTAIGFVHLRLMCGPAKIPKIPCSIANYCEEQLCSDSFTTSEMSPQLPLTCSPGYFVSDVIRPCPQEGSIHVFKTVTIEKGPKQLFYRVYLHKKGSALAAEDFSWVRFRLMPFPDLPSSSWRPLTPLATNKGGIWMRLEAKITCSQHHFGENCAIECVSDSQSQCLDNGTRKCLDGWEGVNCSQRDLCANTECAHGVCWHEAGIAHCDCEFGWRGQNCDLKDPCATFDCRNSSCDVTADGQAVCTKDGGMLDLEGEPDSEGVGGSVIVGASVVAVLFIVLCFLCTLLFVLRNRRRTGKYRNRSAFFEGSSGVYEDPDNNHYSDSAAESEESYDRPGPMYSDVAKDEDNYDVSHPPYSPMQLSADLGEQRFFKD